VPVTDSRGSTGHVSPVETIAGSGFGDTDPARGWVAHAWLLEAAARDALGETAAAEDALEHALSLAESGGVLVPFLFHRAPELLERHARHCPAHAALISRILTLLTQGPGPVRHDGPAILPAAAGTSGESSAPDITQPLSEAEIRVLRYLPLDLSVPEIAGQLSLSVNTIRTHMRHIYDKLQAHRRRDVVARARTLGLLASH
jgi:LuxR family transcriptional regulator, maltose regulon positive regulatory protein